jgi:DNA-nicking Smr family endonuclease
LAKHKLPAYFLDFETIQFAVPIWKGTRPYQSHTFQFSVHRLARTGELDHEAFLDLSGNDPTKALAEALITACGERGPIFVYSSFEAARIRELGKRFP